MGGKGGALDVVAAAMVAMIMLVLHFDTAKGSANYLVGGLDGTGYYWSAKSNPYYYPNGSTLRTGDTLEFNYNKDVHNVVGVGPTGYKKCDGSKGKTYSNTGNNKITLTKGWNYFICTKTAKHKIRNMCLDYKMKIAVNAN